MSADAGFEDGAEQPLRLRAETPEDLAVISALVQDAVGLGSEVAWLPRRRRFTLLLNRFRWEDAGDAERRGRPFERVRCLLTFDGVLRVRASGIDPRDPKLAVSLLAIGFTPRGDGAGDIRVVLAGSGAIALSVECLDVTLTDVTRPYLALSSAPPRHPDD